MLILQPIVSDTSKITEMRMSKWNTSYWKMLQQIYAKHPSKEGESRNAVHTTTGT